MKLQCPKCNTINKQTAQFCNGCGIEFLFDSNISNSLIENKPISTFYEYLTAGLVIFLLFIFAVYIISSPYLALWGMKSAAENKDAETFSSYIDFPVLRENLKAKLNAMMLENIAKDEKLKDNPFSGLALAAAPMIINNMIDAFVSPQGIEKLFKNVPVTDADSKVQNPADSLNPENFKDGITSTGYISVNQFRVTNKSKDGKSVDLLFERHWLWNWKLFNIKIKD